MFTPYKEPQDHLNSIMFFIFLGSLVLLAATCNDSSFTGKSNAVKPASVDQTPSVDTPAPDVSSIAKNTGGQPDVTNAVQQAGPSSDVNTKVDNLADSANPNQKNLYDVATGQPSNCVLGYPFASDNPRTSITFPENEILVASSAMLGATDTLKIYYSDEHALALGVRQVITSSGTKDYPIAASAQDGTPTTVKNPQVGTTDMTGDQAGTDTLTCADPVGCARPIFPALFITDITNRPQSLAGDWQYHGTPIPPDAVIGVWKGSIRNVSASSAVTVTADADPKKNNSNLGSGEVAPKGVGSEGYSAEIQWDIQKLGLQSGHIYRAQFMIHDGDHGAGDAGQGCALIKIQ